MAPKINQSPESHPEPQLDVSIYQLAAAIRAERESRWIREIEPVPQGVQDPLPGMPEARGPNMEVMIAFGSIPNLMGRHVRKDVRLTIAERDLVKPDFLDRSTVGQNGKNTVDGLLLSASEYGAILRYGKGFKNAVTAKTEASNAAHSGDSITGERVIRSALHAFAGKLPVHEHVLASLDEEIDRLDQIIGYQHVPHLRRGLQKNMLMLASTARTSFDNLIHAVADNQEWTVEQRLAAARALDQNLFTGPQSDKIYNWKAMSEVCRAYAGHKHALFAQRKKVIETNIRLGEEDLATFRAQFSPDIS